jgi:hypothetical protein
MVPCLFYLMIRLVCWNEDLARERARQLEQAGFEVDASRLNPSGLIGHFRANPPQAVLIDLDRLPSQGAGVAGMLRQSKTTRHIPVVFAGGPADKVERIRGELPDALFTEWSKVAGALKKALRRPPVDPVRPTPHMQRYAGASLLRKLGFAPNMQAAILGAPDDFAEKVGALPDGFDAQSKIGPRTKLAVWFVRSRQELEAGVDYLCARLPEGSSVWIVHPKQSGRYQTDFNQNDVRAAGLAAGLVDYKVCAVDEDWSGLKFARKRR